MPMICHFVGVIYAELRGMSRPWLWIRYSINETYISVELKSVEEPAKKKTKQTIEQAKRMHTICHTIGMGWYGMACNILSSCALISYCQPSECIAIVMCGNRTGIPFDSVSEVSECVSVYLILVAKPFHISNFCANILFHFYLNLFLFCTTRLHTIHGVLCPSFVAS